MMRTLIAVFRKEVLDNVRDRRTLASALIMGPLFGPMSVSYTHLRAHETYEGISYSVFCV